MIIVPDRPLANRRQEECDDFPSMFSTTMIFIITMTMVMYLHSGRVISLLNQSRLRGVYISNFSESHATYIVSPDSTSLYTYKVHMYKRIMISTISSSIQHAFSLLVAIRIAARPILLSFCS